MEWMLGAIASAIVAWIVTSVLGYLPSPRATIPQVAEWFRKPAPGGRFTVLLSRLHADSRGHHTRHVRNILLEMGDMIDIYGTSRTLKLKEAALQSEALLWVEKTAKRWLKRRNCDLLIWGEVYKDQNTISLSFVHKDTLCKSQNESDYFGSPISFGSYKLQGTALDGKFSEDFKLQLQLAVLLQMETVSGEGIDVIAPLTPLVSKLRTIRRSGFHGFDDRQRASLLFLLGAAESTMGKQTGDLSRVEDAIDIFNEALDGQARSRDPYAWAMTQNILGTTLATIGKTDRDTRRLDASLAAFEAVLSALTREHHPEMWAAAQCNLAMVLIILGERTGIVEYFERANRAISAALEERTKQRVPHDWALTQISRGRVLEALGEKKHDSVLVRKAADVYQSALGILTQGTAPLYWAGAQNSLGNALLTLGRWEEDVGLLERATQAYNEALKVYTKKLEPQNWASVQNNLGSALYHLGKIKSDIDILSEAVSMFYASLDIRTRERVPLEWAMTHENLGETLQDLGIQELTRGNVDIGLAYFWEAIDAFDATLMEYTRDRKPVSWGMVQVQRGITLSMLGGFQEGTDHHMAAKEAFEGALAVFEQDADSEERLKLTRDALRKVEQEIRKGKILEG